MSERDDERAAVVAWLSNLSDRYGHAADNTVDPEHGMRLGCAYNALIEAVRAIEAGEHLGGER